MTQPQDDSKTKKIKLQSDALNANAGNNVDKQIKSDQQKPTDGSTIASGIDDVDLAPAGNANNVNASTSSGTINTKSTFEDRRNSIAFLKFGGNSLISRDALILLPEGGKNSTANGDKYSVTRSSRNSDNENSDTDVSKQHM